MSKPRLKNNKPNGMLNFTINKESSSLMLFTISVAPALVKKIKEQTIEVYRNKIKTRGFEYGKLPESYVENNCLKVILDSCKKHILKFWVLDFLDESIRHYKFVCAASPRLIEVQNPIDGGLEFIFRASIIDQIPCDNWKNIAFNPPRRKLYKDLDRQASLFISQAEAHEQQAKALINPCAIASGDWVGFEATLLGVGNQPVAKEHKNRFWMRVETKYLASVLHKAFLDKKVGDSFIVEQLPIFGYPSDLLSIKGRFKCVIDSLLKTNYFSLELFKSAFKLTDYRSMHEKLIEIFSFRNDISQRRLIIEEAFRVLFAKIKFEVPRYLVLRRQESLLDNIRKIPDYNVYKANPNFNHQISCLAEKQLKEEILTEHLAMGEDLSIGQQDIFQYLNLFSHQRLMEFIYFRPPAEIVSDMSLPTRESSLKNVVLKEKTLNHIIRSLCE